MTPIEKFIYQFITLGGYNKVLNGLLVTAELAVAGLLIGIFIGTLIGLVKVMPKTNVITKILDKICVIYVGFFRGTPIVVQLLIGYWILMPALGLNISAVLTAIIIFGLNSGAYVSEIMRGGINSVDKGQLEAARALGLGFWKGMFYVVIPQSFKNILPTLGNEFIMLIKDTSVVSFIAVVDLTRALKDIASVTYEFVIPYIMLALIYLILVILITILVRFIEKRFKKNERA